MQKILAIIVTYYPERELLERNVSAIVDNVDRILIWENTPVEELQRYRYIDHPKAEYCGDGINSISHALNCAWRYAMVNGYDYLLTMDQDSEFVHFGDYLNATVYNPNCPQGIWTPTVVVKRSENVLPKDAGGLKEISHGITSGMLQSVSLITQNGGWNEAFAIDGVDIEYCLRAAREGIRSYLVERAVMIQRFGNPLEYRFKRWNAVLLNYSPRRYYELFRSCSLLVRMYPEQKYLKTHYKPYWHSKIKKIVFFEENGITKLYYILKGIVVGNCCRLPTIPSTGTKTIA